VKQAVEVQRSDPATAERLLREAVATDSNYYGAQLNLGLLVLQNESRVKQAVSELEKTLAMKDRLRIKDSTIYGELAFAYHRADNEKSAADMFGQGVQHLAELDPVEQRKLLERGVAFFLDYQNPAGARQLVKQAANKGLNQYLLLQIQGFLINGVARLTKNDAPDGWVLFAKQKRPPEPGGKYLSQLFEKIDRSAGVPTKGDIVTPKGTTVNMRSDRIHPEDKDAAKDAATLASWVGVARLEERFEVLEVVPVSVPDAVALWMHIKRVKR
jgi:hypothetical protein